MTTGAFFSHLVIKSFGNRLPPLAFEIASQTTTGDITIEGLRHAGSGGSGERGDMRRKNARLIGLAPLLVVATGATASLGMASASPVASMVSEAQAPRIDVPGPHGITRKTPCNKSWRSTNWSGYAVNCATFTSVSGSWTVPTVTAVPHSKKAVQYSATWVGIDGFDYGDDNLIQAGTEQDWIDGTPFYRAWWEILPADETIIPSISVHPGDVMAVSITQGSPDWTITVTDTTRGQSFTTQEPFGGVRSSAEWIQEAPTVGGGIASLAHDSTVEFDELTANGANPGLTGTNAGVMVKGGKDISTPSAPNAQGNGFAVAYGKVAPPVPTS